VQPLLTTPSLSLVVPVYGNEGSIGPLLEAIAGIARRAGGGFEAVFVVDGSPDRSYALLHEQLPRAGFPARLLTLSRNFGAFAAIRAGLEAARGQVVAVMAADLQEPPELVLQFLEVLGKGNTDVAFGVRTARADAFGSRLASGIFWSVYRRFVMPEIPPGGVDIFALSSAFRDRLLSLRESNTSLLAQLFWLGGRRAFVPYERRAREHGRSAWTLRKKLRYLSDSVFAFTDLPVRLLFWAGALALMVSAVIGMAVLAARLSGWMVVVPGYAATMLTILFFGALNALGLGVVGTYAWRAFENTKARPLAVVQTDESFDGGKP
jgi:glycosyltransferase involved in cell wall biosynthesis